MKPFTYLCFTLLSIAIQFCLMDFINGKLGADTVIDSNSTIAQNLSDLFGKLKQKPHALYYRTEKAKFQVKTNTPIKYNNDSITETTLTSTVFDLLYDENVSVTDIESESATETLFTTEFDNVTEITFFDKTPSTVKPTEVPKKLSTNKCYCNLLYKACDINCCCDNDCTDLDKSVFNKKCQETGKEICDIRNNEYLNMCSSYFACKEELQSDLFGYLFCIGKVNLPTNRKTFKSMLYLDVDSRLKWHSAKKKIINYKFTKEVYTIDQPIWLITNGTIEYLELPITVTNEYCNSKKVVKFLRNEYIKCYVKLKDLHMLDVIKSPDRTRIASAKESTINSTKMDCTTLHCTNWTILICDEYNCLEYDNDLHEPSCSESYCKNIGVKAEYEFYCNVSMITKAIVKFHVRTMSMALELVTQEITVNFYIGNNSIDNIVKFSGNPGYIRGLPIIVSLSESNHTDNFYNYSLGRSNYLLQPSNKNGECVITNLTHNIVKFGHNKRLNCRANFGYVSTHNGTDGCLNIQAKIDELFGLSPNNIFISPYGNPQDVDDEKWISLQKFDKRNIYGEYHPKDSKLICFNLITRISFIIAFMDTNDVKVENKILSARIDSTTKNITYSIEDLSTVITIDTIFIDASKPNVHEYIGTPQLNFHLPKDFFYPLASSKGNMMQFQMLILCLYSFVSCVLQIK